MANGRRARVGSSVDGPTPPSQSRGAVEPRSHFVAVQGALNVSRGGCIFDRFDGADASFGR